MDLCSSFELSKPMMAIRSETLTQICCWAYRESISPGQSLHWGVLSEGRNVDPIEWETDSDIKFWKMSECSNMLAKLITPTPEINAKWSSPDHDFIRYLIFCDRHVSRIRFAIRKLKLPSWKALTRAYNFYAKLWEPLIAVGRIYRIARIFTQ